MAPRLCVMSRSAVFKRPAAQGLNTRPRSRPHAFRLAPWTCAWGPWTISGMQFSDCRPPRRKECSSSGAKNGYFADVVNPRDATSLWRGGRLCKPPRPDRAHRLHNHESDRIRAGARLRSKHDRNPYTAHCSVRAVSPLTRDGLRDVGLASHRPRGARHKIGRALVAAWAYSDPGFVCCGSRGTTPIGRPREMRPR